MRISFLFGLASAQHEAYIENSPSVATALSAEPVIAHSFDNEVATVTVDEHNKFRALHCNTANVAYDHEMEVLAQKIADKKVFKHSSRDERNGAGENLAWNMEPTIGAAIAKGVKNFYSEIEFYQWDNPGNDGIGGEAVGHFTQVIKNCPFFFRITQSFLSHSVSSKQFWT